LVKEMTTFHEIIPPNDGIASYSRQNVVRL